ncbi:MAG TPA: ABC transporter ATP-binding protein [Kofleriaceae bacterium]|nr:ABC transporter ATP-binding protein [Kofleriaceae bacterium]
MTAAPLLAIEAIDVVYEQAILALRGVSLTVPAGSIVALLGANGAGKTTTLKAASGLLAAERGAITRGAIHVRGRSLVELTPRDLVRAGVVQVLEGRRCFPHLSVEENLITGALVRRPTRAALRAELDRVYALFPRLTRLRRTAAGYTSGGEQQMVAIGRALLARPTLILLDEPSMGLAPQVVEEIFATIRRLHQDDGVSFLVAEQNARLALRYADHGHVLENGRVVASGTAAELRARPDVEEFYLGVGRRDASSPREVRP